MLHGGGDQETHDQRHEAETERIQAAPEAGQFVKAF
jgi:hypothetical protein